MSEEHDMTERELLRAWNEERDKPDETLCEYCGENPPEPNLACCSMSRCLTAYYKDLREAEQG
jgi:hypothetical protein